MVLLSIFWHSADAIMWNLAPNTQKCLKEELHANVLVVGEYYVTEAPGQRVDYFVSYSDQLVSLIRHPVTSDFSHENHFIVSIVTSVL